MRTNRIYILPTRKGFTLLGVIIVMVLTAATYNNNLIYLIAFFLFAIFFVCMMQTHYNLKGTRMSIVAKAEAFEGEPLAVLVQIEQRRARLKRGISIRSRSKLWSNLTEVKTSLTTNELHKAVRVPIIAARWGVHPVPTFIMETTYPLGLFRAWKVFRQEGELIVYPRPEGFRELPTIPADIGDRDHGLQSSPEGDFGELKPYRVGESYHQIAWKHYARGRALYTKMHWGGEHKHFDIPWIPEKQEFEAYLRQMSAWIQIAVESDATFAMELPSVRVETGSGLEHAQRCWRALARLKEVS